MIPAEPGLVLRAPNRIDIYRVAGWDDDGTALVVPLRGIRLQRADELGFDDLREAWIQPDYQQPIAIAGSGTERCSVHWPDGETRPVGAWQLRRNGVIVPCVADERSVQLMPADEFDVAPDRLESNAEDQGTKAIQNLEQTIDAKLREVSNSIDDIANQMD